MKGFVSRPFLIILTTCLLLIGAIVPVATIAKSASPSKQDPGITVNPTHNVPGRISTIPAELRFLNNPGHPQEPPTIQRQRTLAPGVSTASAVDNWTTYLYNASRDSYNANETILNPGTAVNIKQNWVISTGSHISVQPIVVNGVIYWGSWDGYMHATDLNGNQLWSTFLGVNNDANCNPPSIGVASSATVKSIYVNGTQTPIVYVGGGDGKLYALYASTGKVLWSTSLGSPATPPAVFMWSSPVTFNGSVYQGVASFGDCPLVQGQLVKLNQKTGAIQKVAKLVPDGCAGAGVWSSPTIDQRNGKIYVTTGTQDDSCKVNGQPYVEPYALAVVELDLNLTILGGWRIPASQQGSDSDFGVSPTLFNGKIKGVSTPLVGAGNKNGFYYAFVRDQLANGPVWEDQLAIGGGCPDCGDGTISSSAWDRKTLYEAAGNTTINGVACMSSVRAINPSTGGYIWEHCNPDHAVVASVTEVPGLIIEEEGNNIDILDSSTGKEIIQLTPPGANSVLDAPASVSQGLLFVGDLNGNLYEFG